MIKNHVALRTFALASALLPLVDGKKSSNLDKECSIQVPEIVGRAACWGVSWDTFLPHLYIPFVCWLLSMLLSLLAPWYERFMDDVDPNESWIMTYIGSEHEVRFD